MYADDVAAVVTASSVDTLEENLNNTATQLSNWFQTNGLALNLTKTHFIHFWLSGTAPRPLSVSVASSTINQVENTVFLGFQVDRGLQWTNHIDGLCSKLGRACYALSRVARVVSVDVARACYFATVHSLLQYGTELWARAADWQRAFRMQKRAVRAIVRVRRCESARPLFKKLGILTLPSILIYQVAVYVRLNVHTYAKQSDVHTHFTRHRNDMSNIKHKLEKSGRLTHVMGPLIYNKLPSRITEKWLVEHTFYKHEEFISHNMI
ncbi:hypothetical protein K1T71_004777 [Dendrolimus kikuchii]|uniref:Uncharacterized protein n=1 Tax=Dendrolimus kikuchii TaxID=765133 RepID=A0ACC1D8N0_9NEOP|nr:hypothetical protein K1T71_004777 [Dendrolimus kikuchii]